MSAIFFAAVIIWSTDSGAYFIGKSMGKRKLWPEISPNKTVEGFIGGIVTAVVLSLVFQAVTGFAINHSACYVYYSFAQYFWTAWRPCGICFKASLPCEGFRDNTPRSWRNFGQV